jgi:hypothetical protein
MGRGRAKAKQTKVARQLKYNSGGTDLERLRAELLGESDDQERAEDYTEGEDDPYARYADGPSDDADDADDADEDDPDDGYPGNGRRARR